MKAWKVAPAVGALWMVMSSFAHAAPETGTGCPAGAWTDWSSGTGVSISWSFSGISGVVAFQPTRILLGGGVAPLTPADVQKYAPTLDNLRAAAVAEKKVEVAWDSVSHIVSTIIVRWDQPC